MVKVGGGGQVRSHIIGRWGGAFYLWEGSLVEQKLMSKGKMLQKI